MSAPTRRDSLVLHRALSPQRLSVPWVFASSGLRRRCRLRLTSEWSSNGRISLRKHSGGRRLVGADRAGDDGSAGGIAVVAAVDGGGEQRFARGTC
jgi:hypothetical protein